MKVIICFILDKLISICFLMFIQEDNNSQLIALLEAQIFKLSNEIKEIELVNINVSKRAKSLKGQLTKSTHPYALTKCITTNKNGWRYHHCNKAFSNKIKSFYCTVFKLNI